MNNLENSEPKRRPKRTVGLEKVYFDGSESLSSSKFALVFNNLKNRISQEEHAYTSEELKNAYDIVKLADNLQLLYVTGDTPLYSTQSGFDVNILAQNMVTYIQKPLIFNELPYREQDIYQSLYKEVRECSEKRNAFLEEYITVEKFLRQLNEDNLFDISCLLGMSNRVRTSLDTLAKFNKMITERFNLMRTHLGNDNIYKVNFVLGHIEKFVNFHNEFFPVKSKRRQGKYDEVFNESEKELPNFGPFRDVYNFDFGNKSSSSSLV